jgi:hypothetical protein
LEKPLAYATLLEKTTQITALTYSNNVSIDLADILDEARLPAIVKSAARSAHYGFDLQHGHFEKFTHNFMQNSDINKLKFKKIEGTAFSLPFYTARIQTRRGCVETVRASTLARTALELASKITHNLMPQEYMIASQSHSIAQALMRAVNDLNMLGCLLDKNFIPLHKVQAKKSTDSAVFLRGTSFI